MWSCLWAPCWGRTSRRPRGWSCSASTQTCCRRAASRWTLWTEPGRTQKDQIRHVCPVDSAVNETHTETNGEITRIKITASVP